MPRIHVARTVYDAKKAVKRVLCTPDALVGVIFKGVDLGGPRGSLSVITIATTYGDVYVFDLRTEPDILVTGQVLRILQSNDITKVFHNGCNAVLFLKHTHNIQLRKFFDTQVVYEMLLVQRGLPPRAISLRKLCSKFYISELYTPSRRLQVLMSEDRNVWSRRPFDQDMLLTVASDAVALPVLCKKIAGLLESPLTDCGVEAEHTSNLTGVVKRSVGFEGDDDNSNPGRTQIDSGSGRKMDIPMLIPTVYTQDSVPCGVDSHSGRLSEAKRRCCSNGPRDIVCECENYEDGIEYPIEPTRPADGADSLYMF